MALSKVVSYLAGLGFLKWHDRIRRRLCLVVPIVVDLLLLAFFKYINFALDTLRWLGSRAHFSVPIQPIDIILPVGISFYTFHTITYIVDSYRGTIKPTRNIFEFAWNVSVSCQLVAGPIVRFRQIEGDLDRLDHADRTGLNDSASSFLALGFDQHAVRRDDHVVLHAGSGSRAVGRQVSFRTRYRRGRATLRQSPDPSRRAGCHTTTIPHVGQAESRPAIHRK